MDISLCDTQKEERKSTLMKNRILLIYILVTVQPSDRSDDNSPVRGAPFPKGRNTEFHFPWNAPCTLNTFWNRQRGHRLWSRGSPGAVGALI